MRRLERLTAKFVATTRRSGSSCDGGGLNLVVSTTAAKCWVFRYSRGKNPNGKPRQREMGLGSLNSVSLAEARERATEARRLLSQGLDPIDVRDAKARESAQASAEKITFGECAKRFIDQHAPGWRNEKHVAQWRTTITTYCQSLLDTPVAEIDTAATMRVLQPIWHTRRETAVRLRGRIERILDAAKALGHREGDNPARRENLRELLGKDRRRERVQHHRALPPHQLPAFMDRLRAERGVAARAAEFTILCASRTGETIGAKWDEIDLDAGVWVVPETRMKAKRPHKVPLSEAAVKLLHELPRTNEFVFPGQKRGRHLSNMAMLTLIQRRLNVPATMHGIARASFRTWAAESTSFPRDVCEAALAHQLDDTEGAYQRGDQLEKRRQLMEAWAAYCARPATEGKVFQLHYGKEKAFEVAA